MRSDSDLRDAIAQAFIAQPSFISAELAMRLADIAVGVVTQWTANEPDREAA